MPDLSGKYRFGTEAHNRLLERVLTRRDFSQQKMSERYERWGRCDEQAIAYLPEKLVDSKRRALREAGEPQFTTVYIPYDYGLVSAAHTYLTSVFLGRSPIMQYVSRDGRGEEATLGLEALVDYQLRVGRHLPVQYIWFMDVVKYGFGVIGQYWDDEIVSVRSKVQIPEMFMGVPTGEYKEEYQQRLLRGYSGAKIWNVRPYDFFPDPRVHLRDLQRGEFCGCYTYVNWNDIVKDEAYGYFNVDAYREIMSGGSALTYFGEGSPVITRPSQPGDEFYYQAKKDCESGRLLNMHIELIPDEWELARGKYPEKWIFTVGNDQVLIGCKPAGDYHNKYPYNAFEYEMDSAPLFKRGVYEQSEALNNVLNWLYNTHFYNTRKSLNDMFVVDPTKIVVKDVEDPEPGKIIRLKAEAYGQDVRSAIWQFPVNNVTQQHLQDSSVVGNMLQRATGINDNIMGLLSTGGRKTATEVRTSSSFAINRLKTVSEWLSATGFDDYSQLSVQLCQQYYSTAQKIRVAGEAFQDPLARRFLEVSPDDIQGFFDFVPVDGTLPVDRFAQVSMWGQLMQQMANMPQVFAQYDMGRVFAWIAQLGGLKNISHFKIQTVPGQPPGTIPVGVSNVTDLRRGQSPQGATGVSRPVGGKY